MTITNNLKSFFMVCLSLIVFTHCGTYEAAISADTSAFDDFTSGTTTSIVAGGQVSELNISNDVVDISANVPTGKNIALLLVNLAPNNTVQGFEIEGSETADPIMNKSLSYLTKTPRLAKMSAAEETTETMHEKIRGLENLIDESTPLPSLQNSRYTVKQLDIGDAKEFKVIRSFNNGGDYTTVTAILAYSADHFDLYIDERDLEAFNGDDLTITAENFESIIPQEEELFGTPSDVNGDGKFTVLLSHNVNALGVQYGGLITGYFYATDLFDSETYSASNEMEIIYGLVPDPQGFYGPSMSYDLAINNIIPGVLAHEYQHMINFNRHFFIKGGAAEAPSLNEGLAHLAEDLYSIGDDGYMTDAGIENPSRVNRYLSNIDQVCFLCGSNLSQRGGTYLFLRYLYEQAEAGHLSFSANGKEFIGFLMDGTYRDIKNLSYAITGDPSNIDGLNEALSRFGLTIYLSGTGKAKDDQLEIAGLNLRSVQDDHRGTFLNGPAVITVDEFPYTQTLTGYSFAYLQISGQSLQAEGGKFRLNLSDNAKFRAYLIQ